MNLPAIREKSKKNMTRGKKQALMAGVCAGLIALTAVVNGLLTNSVRSGQEEFQTAELFEGQGEDQAQHAANEPVSAGTEQTESGEDDYFAVFRQDREEKPSVPAKSPRPHRRRAVPKVVPGADHTTP